MLSKYRWRNFDCGVTEAERREEEEDKFSYGRISVVGRLVALFRVFKVCGVF